MKSVIGKVKPLARPTTHVTGISHCTTTSTSTRTRQLSVKSSWNSDSSRARVTHRVASLDQKWREYQGIKNWDGLLDPLDDGLRHEILRYGDFVEAAYRCFEFDTSSPDYATCKFTKNTMLDRCGLGESGYKVTKNLHATCGVQLPGWIDRMPRSSWIGYVAVCNDEKEIARLGRRDVVIAYRGTATCLEWIENLRATLTPMHNNDVAPEKKRAMVQKGFLSMYTSATNTCPSLQDMVREEISRIIETYGNEPLSVTVTGHSLGAALATLTAYDITSTFKQSPMVTVLSFGGPRVGNRNFRSQLENSGTQILRIVNSTDVITKVPGFLVDGSNDMTKKGVGLQGWLKKQVDEADCFRYADVGKELRLYSDASPYLTKSDFATCHDLKTYLHLVDGFVSSSCPFRTTTKRLLTGMNQEKQQILVR
ncbi:putative phospholipase A(1) [Helianthus annuus]|nr:putative phospholipase A(1) [Helianthus annuus]KAJ0565384.1 putative phospholipase A(1) [Helianthus annuus]KAJ0736824.1 putative phospholipase A(1) [Helianthus annuus]